MNQWVPELLVKDVKGTIDELYSIINSGKKELETYTDVVKEHIDTCVISSVQIGILIDKVRR